MDNKRVIIAVVLSMLVLIGWNFVFPPQPTQRVEPQQSNVTQDSAAPAQTSQRTAPAEIEAQALDVVAGEFITVKTPLYTAVFNSHGGVLQQFTLHEYQESIEPDSPDVDLVGTASTMGPMGLLLNRKATWNIGSWAAATDIEGNKITEIDLSGTESKQLVFTGEVDDQPMQRPSWNYRNEDGGGIMIDMFCHWRYVI
ncbi:MAG: membrane protein insertase YidC, partial [Oceanidesulfovibrio sp.]